TLTATVQGLITDFTSITVLRNAPESCSIRLALKPTTRNNYWGRTTLDLTIRRGSRVVSGYLTSDVSDKWKIAVATPEACAANNFGAVTTGSITSITGFKFQLMVAQSATAS